MRTFLWLIILMAGYAGFSSSASAAWRCEASDKFGDAWYAVASSRGAAASGALRFCRQSSDNPRSCDLDYCKSYQSSHYRGIWECYAVGFLGGRWHGMGMTRTEGLRNSYANCLNNSLFPGSCEVGYCLRKY
ncbi:hypothetical protein [Aquicella lusitana]|uniref:DUF4189 domain-containing protein n=1 Tax=Aquicella lusitana TaxID=254246 RepID=A0A370GQQ2_9COXI|nr:hypothetical protein [Aquicella lusitana]RDI46048.1 hypothetical protein C8D86_10652 [Aquicella lusitana]VVC73355.1 hypothetical protein AQULUS_10940 [Aquicella lusitana]